MAILEAKGIQKRFEGITALDNVDFFCEAGKITGLLGANGSGKSTLSKIIAGVLKPDIGEIIYCGKPVRFSSPAEAKKNGISMVFQNLSLVRDLRVWQNIVLGAEKKKGILLDNHAAREVCSQIIEELSPGLDINSSVYQLSPGEMQIVEIAKALVENPRLLILDEPTASLEQEQVKRLFAYIHKLADRNIAMIFTSHRMKEVMEICDNVIVFKDGKNVGSIDFEKEEKNTGVIVQMITGKTNTEQNKRENRILPEEYIMEVEDLQYGTSLKGLSFKVKKGEVLGIGGLSGQGQHELMQALAGSLAKCKAKSIKLNGKEMRLNTPAKSIRNGIFLVPGDRNIEGLFLSHSIYNNYIFPKIALGKHPLIIPRKKYRAQCQKTVNQLSIAAKSIDSPVSTLSGGNAQKVVIGKWLSFDTKVLLLSDPAKGVDVGVKQDIYELILRMSKEKGMSTVLYASDADELIKYCDRVLIMFEGHFTRELCGEEIKEETVYEAMMSAKLSK